jgi:hypothetical protein
VRPRCRSDVDRDGRGKTIFWGPACQTRHTSAGATDGAPIELAAQPGSETDKLARQLMAPEIARAHAEGTDPLVLVGMGRLNDADELLFVQLQSAGECGSAGCSTVSFRYEGDHWIRIMDTVSGTVRITQTRHRGMPDLIVNGSRLAWDGTKYPG